MDNQTIKANEDSKDLLSLEAKKEELETELELETETTAMYKGTKDDISDEVDKMEKSLVIHKLKSILKCAGIWACFVLIAIYAKLPSHRLLGELAYNLFTQNFVVTMCGVGVVVGSIESIKQYHKESKVKKEEIVKLKEILADHEAKYEFQIDKSMALKEQIDQIQEQIDLKKRTNKDLRRDLTNLNIFGGQNPSVEEDRAVHLSR